MFVTKPEFPPVDGFIEVIDGEGNHRLVPSTETQKRQELEAENKLLKAQLQAQSDRADFIEDCIAEMATQVYGGV